jgi:hypothetical protein
VTGDAAKQLLKAKPGTAIAFGETKRSKATDAAVSVSPNSSQGPSAGGLPKPDLAAPGTDVVAGVGGGAVVAGGSAIAAARVAVVAAKLARSRPDLSPQQLRAALIAGADPANLPPDRSGAGNVRDPQPSPGVTSDPPTAASGALDPIRVELNSAASAELTLRATSGATASPASLTVRPGTPSTVSVRLPQGGTTFGRLESLAAGKVVASTPFLVRPDTVKPVAVGALKVSGGRRVRFTLGSFKRGEKTEIQVAERLILDLVDAKGNVRRSLTVKGGARELMPAEYAYALPRASLPDSSYAFRVRAWAPGQEQPTVRRSATLRP